MDSNMTFSVHIDELRRKVTGTLLYLNQVNDRFDWDCRRMAVQLLVWRSTNKTQMDRVQKLQNFAGKVAIGGAKKYDHATPILEKLQWLWMDKKYFYDICILMF